MIWKRYFLKELIKVFFLFLLGCYFLYILIDFSMHTKHMSFNVEWIKYYLFQFSKYAEILIPLGLMISLIKVLTTLNIHNEIIALMSAGLSLKALMRPFFFAAVVCIALLYLNFQFIQPLIHEGVREESIGSLNLKDNTLLVYQRFDPKKEAFFQSYWVQNPDLIYRIEWLNPFGDIPFGRQIDVLKRENGILKKAQAFDSLEFPEMEFEKRSLFSAVCPPRLQSITQLLSNLKWRGPLTDKEAQIMTLFFYKLTLPLVCFLTVYASAPYCLRFSRRLSVFLIYALSLFGMITFFTLVNACVILGESQTLPPLIALMLPLTLFFGLFGWKYAKLS